jgi:hypothetical protein
MTALLLVLAVVAGSVAASTACGVNMVLTIRISLDRAPWHRVVVPYVAGSLVGAACVGLVLAVAGGMVRSASGFEAAWSEPAIAVLLTASTALGLRELGLLRLRLPQRTSQLNSDALSLGVSQRLFWFGLWLGVGFLTFSPYGGLHLLAVAAIFAPSPDIAVLLFVAFGFSRGITVAIAGATAATWEDAAGVGDRIAGGYRTAQVLTAISMSLVAIGAAGSLLS